MSKTAKHHERKDLPPHPVQAVIQDKRGDPWFRPNAIVRCLLDRDSNGLEQIAKLDASAEDHLQFAQLLGLPVADRRFDTIRATIPKQQPLPKKRRYYDPHPMQPVHEDAHGVLRFRRNEIVDSLLDRDSARGRIYPDFPAQTDGGLNWVAAQDFSREDQEQLAQLIGYSVSGYHELSYVSNKSAAQASKLAAQVIADQASVCPCASLHKGSIMTNDSIVPSSSGGASVLSRRSAKLLACRKWSSGTAGAVGHRVGFAVLRHKNVVKRYGVGYRTLLSVNPERWVERFLGNGTSWDQAFTEANAELGVQW